MKYYLLTAFSILGFIVQAAAQEPGFRNSILNVSNPLFNPMIITYIDDGETNQESNLYLVIPYGIGLAVGGILFASDRAIHEEFMEPGLHSRGMDNISRTVARFGTAGPYLIAIPIEAAHGLIFKDRKSLYVAGELGVGFVLEQGVSLGIKSAFGRKRPYESDSPYKFFDGGTSFISGHTITAFTFATIMAQNYPRQDMGFLGIRHEFPLVPVVMYSAAGLVALQRLYSNNHWSSDVYFGAFAGYGVGSLTVYLGNRMQTGRLHLVWNQAPMIVYSISFN